MWEELKALARMDKFQYMNNTCIIIIHYTVYTTNLAIYGIRIKGSSMYMYLMGHALAY